MRHPQAPFGVLLIKNPGPVTTLQFEGMDGSTDTFETFDAAYQRYRTARLTTGDLGGVLCYWQDNDQLALYDSLDAALDAGLIPEAQYKGTTPEPEYQDFRMAVFGHNSNGEPDVFYCCIECLPIEAEEGLHYVTAQELGEQEGYDSGLACDENDPAGAVLQLCHWETIPVHRRLDDGTFAETGRMTTPPKEQ